MPHYKFKNVFPKIDVFFLETTYYLNKSQI